jgi:hypothetical protein
MAASYRTANGSLTQARDLERRRAFNEISLEPAHRPVLNQQNGGLSPQYPEQHEDQRERHDAYQHEYVRHGLTAFSLPS